MACQLRPDPSHDHDALGTRHTSPSVFIQSAAAPEATVVAATLDGTPIDVSEGIMALPSLEAGVNVLRLVVEGLEAGDDVELVEQCGVDETQSLKKKFAGAAPGGADPVVGFRIHAS